MPNPKTHKIYFDFGTETLDKMYEHYQMKVDEIMKAKKFGKKNGQTLKFEEKTTAKNLGQKDFLFH